MIMAKNEKVTTKKVKKITKDNCSECGGTGLDPRVPETDRKPCPNCSA
jgi:hypothetical protein